MKSRIWINLSLFCAALFLLGYSSASEPLKSRFCLSGFRLSSESKVQHQELTALQELNISLFRMGLNYPPKAEELAQVRLLASHGIKTLGIIRAPNYIPPDDLDRFSEEVNEIAEYFKRDVAYFEIWNEQNAGYRFWKPKEDPAAYARLLKTAYIAIKKVAPKAEVIYGGLFYHPQGITGAEAFLEKSFQGFPSLNYFFDGFAFHPYPLYPPSHPPDYGKGSEVSLPEMMERLTAILYRHNADKPFFLTELGWAIYGRVTERRQASYLVRAYTLALAMPRVKAICWYTLRDSPHKPNHFPPEGAFGLLHSPKGESYRPKLSFLAYRALARLLGNARFKEDLRKRWKLNPTQFAFIFSEKKHEIILYWEGRNRKFSSVDIRLRSNASELNMFGQKITHFKKGKAVLKLSNVPHYLLCKGKCIL